MLTGLPAPLSSFIGRHDELSALVGLVSGSRWLSLTGGPGVGKSRLALEVARRAASDTGPVAYADLAVDEDAGIPSLEGITQLPKAIKLLVLDNADHALDVCRKLGQTLPTTRPDLHILLTSREPLGAGDEVVWRVSPLTIPPPGATHTPEALGAYDSVALFSARAGALREDFRLDADNAEPVAVICRRLEGNPLALELAAGRTAVLSATEIVEHLDADPEQIFQPGRTTPARHRSLAAAIAWSHDRGSEPERILLRRLSVFSGGFTLEAAQDVCAAEGLHRPEVAQHLDRLVARSLVETKSTPTNPSRFFLTGSVRRFAHDRLVEAGEAVEIEALHAAWCAVFASVNSRDHGVVHDEASVDRLVAEHDNVRAAFEWAVAHRRAKLGLSLARGQMLFWQTSGHFAEAMEWLEKVIAVSKDAPAPLRASALHDAGYVAMLLGESDRARAHLEEAVGVLAQWPYSKGKSSTRTRLGFMVSVGADRRGLQILEETLAEARVAGDGGSVSEVLVAYGQARLFRAETSVAEANFAEAIEVAAGLGQTSPTAIIGLGWAALAQGRYDQAESELSKGLSLARREADAHATAVALMWSGELARRRGRYDQGRLLLEEARQWAEAMGTPYPLATSLMGLGYLALAEGERTRAMELFEDQLGLARRAGLAFLIAPGLVGLARAAWAAGELDEARAHLQEALEVGYDHEDRWGIAAALHARGWVARLGGDRVGAAAFHHRALALQQEIGDAPGMVASLEALAGLSAGGGGTDAAAMVFGAAADIRANSEYPRSPLEEQIYTTDVALLENAMGAERLQEARDEGRTLSLADTVAYASRHLGRQARPTTGWASLSPPECEAAALVEQNLTNRQIAQRLQVSTETVKSRVASAFSKLGISSRRELAEAVRRHTRDSQQND